VKLAFGTDAGVFPHGLNAKQFDWMVKYSLSPMQAIQTATINAADLIGKSEEFGSITPGKYADIIAVSEDATENVTALEHVDFVMKNGVVYKNLTL
jgi:imidazolonepropionase-like amidohydrolase